MRHTKLVLLVALAALLLVVPACKKQQVETTPPPAPAVEAPAPAPAPPVQQVEEPFKPVEPEVVEVDPSAAEINASGALKTVYFAYDKADLTDAARQTLQSNADWLKSHAKWNVVIEGHCDERGTIEYNLELGQRRASSAREYLASLGIPASRLRVVTYGEERPADPGHGEAAWSKNRRGDFKVE